MVLLRQLNHTNKDEIRHVFPHFKLSNSVLLGRGEKMTTIYGAKLVYLTHLHLRDNVLESVIDKLGGRLANNK